MVFVYSSSLFFFFFNDTATPEFYPLSLHDPLPISTSTRQRKYGPTHRIRGRPCPQDTGSASPRANGFRDRKSTRLNSSHSQISYAVFCLKKKKKKTHVLNLA